MIDIVKLSAKEFLDSYSCLTVQDYEDMLIDLFLSYTNDYITIQHMAEDCRVNEIELSLVINIGRQLNERKAWINNFKEVA